MKTYIGTKIINAKPMTRGDYNAFRGWTVPADENPADDGYLVEYTDGGKGNTDLYAGYVSWSPKEQFEKAYRETAGLTFGLALEALKRGAKVARAGWNGKGMYVRFVSSWTYTDGIDDNRKTNPMFTIKNVDESVSTWVPSINDCLADDWRILP